MYGNPNRVRFTDPNFEETVQRWFEECDEEFSDPDADPESNITSENAITSDHETGSELSYSASDDDGQDVTESGEDSETSEPVKKYFYGKNRYKWASTEPTRNVLYLTTAFSAKYLLRNERGGSLASAKIAGHGFIQEKTGTALAKGLIMALFIDKQNGPRWVCLCAWWVARVGLSWPADRMRSLSSVLHVCAWGFPAAQTVAALVRRDVDSDELTDSAQINRKAIIGEPVVVAVRPDDPKFEETLLRWNEELDNEPDSDNDGTDYDDHVSIRSDRESTYSTDDSEVESETEQQLPGKVIKGKNGHI
ncbi:unnamed protein product [Acanthoscelides obtectus]|uniref:Frizzled/Smoothened 7TM domain-containing protein n=1 Tax=Acanthoscelides obtectus TaxID=200917 RepID=A0A9P0P5J4_ACAOB|nr:unnamed protein product [Acanthoscelides obtectus]CAK1664205.1 Frizzled-4 [Acanthoscelides obtectus]